MQWMFMPLQRYADFSGRSRRLEYWLFNLAAFIVFMLTSLISDVLVGIAFVALFLPMLAVQVRRFHDQDKSGWYVLLGFIPLIGGIIVLVYMCLRGTPGENLYGPDPLDPTGDLAAVFS